MVWLLIIGILIITNIASFAASSLFLWHLRSDSIYLIDNYSAIQSFYICAIVLDLCFITNGILSKKPNFRLFNFIILAGFLLLNILLIYGYLFISDVEKMPYLTASIQKNIIYSVLPIIAWIILFIKTCNPLSKRILDKL